jgi:hypothetical protein
LSLSYGQGIGEAGGLFRSVGPRINPRLPRSLSRRLVGGVLDPSYGPPRRLHDPQIVTPPAKALFPRQLYGKGPDLNRAISALDRAGAWA